MLKSRTTLAVLVAIALLPVSCAAKKRPSAVATAAAQTPAPAAAPEREQPVDAGPDVQAVDREALGDQALPDAAGMGLAGDSSPLEDVRFEYDSAELADEARRLLERHAQWLQRNAGVRITVEGHCDERGTAEYNLALGDQRARAARDYLVSLGVAGDRLATVSYGKEQPLDPAGTEAAWAKNRRAHFAPVR